MCNGFKMGLQIISYWPDMIMLQGHAVILTFKEATQILRVHIVHIATYVHTKFYKPGLNSF